MVTKNTLHTREKKREKVRFVTTLDLIKCLKQVGQILLLTCAPISDLPANKSTICLKGFSLISKENYLGPKANITFLYVKCTF